LDWSYVASHSTALQAIAGTSLRHQQLIASNGDLQQLLLSALAFKLHWAAAALSQAGLLPSSAAGSGRGSTSTSTSDSGDSGSAPLDGVWNVLGDVGAVLVGSEWAAAAVEHANAHGAGTAGLLEPLVQACCAPLAGPAQCAIAEELAGTLLAQQAIRPALQRAAVLLLAAARNAPAGQANAQRMAWAAVRLMPSMLAATRRLLVESPRPEQLPELHRHRKILTLQALLQWVNGSVAGSPPVVEHANLLFCLQGAVAAIRVLSPSQLPDCAAGVVAALQLLPLVPQLRLSDDLMHTLAKCTVGCAAVAALRAHTFLQQPCEVDISPATAKQLHLISTLACRLVHASVRERKSVR